MISDDIIHEAQNYEVTFNDILKADTDRRLQQEITRDINWARKTLRKNDRIIWFLRWSKIWYQLSGGIWAAGGPIPRCLPRCSNIISVFRPGMLRAICGVLLS